MSATATKPIPHYVQDFLDWLDIEKGLSSKSQENYRQFLKPFLQWLHLKKLDNLKPNELTPEHIWDYRVFLSRKYLTRRGQSLSKATQNYYLIVIRSLLNYFAEHDIPSLPPEKVALARDKTDRDVRFLTLQQLERLLAAPDASTTRGIRDRAIIETLFSTGMRVSELVALNREQIRIRPGMKVFELSIIGKGSRVRTVYFSERAIEWVNKYLAMRNDDFSPLFVNTRSLAKEDQCRLTTRAIEALIKRYAILSGLPSTTTPHVMRHSFATDLLAQGVDLRTIQEFLGHRHIAATQIYAHVTSKKLREIHRKYHGGNRIG